MESHSKHKMAPSTKLALCVFIAIGGYYIWTEHQAHFFQALPFLIFLLCPLMHIFMHHGHDKHHGKGDEGHENHDQNKEGHSGRH